MTDSGLITAIQNIQDNTPNTASEIRDILMEFYLRTPKTGTIIIKDVSNAYISANFDSTGLGINEELGYTLSNGQNGSRSWAGRSPIGWGSSINGAGDYLTMGAGGGSRDAAIVSHTHQTSPNTNLFTGAGDGVSRNRVSIESFGTGTPVNVSVLSADGGGSGQDKNMHPYIVTLITIKL